LSIRVKVAAIASIISRVTQFNLTDIDKLLTTTRSVRKRLDLTRPVPREVVLECLSLALQAPTGGNSQGWRWMVVDDADKRAALADMYRRSFAPYIEMQKKAVADAGVQGMDKIVGSAEYLAEHLHEVPVHVIPCLLGRLPGNVDNTSASGFFGSILPAVWSFMLALRSRGLGSAWTTLHLPFEKEAQELLGIPDTVTQTALIPVAYYTGDDFKPGTRRPVEEVTYLNQWKQRP
jgi:nitroreductase